MQRYRKVTAMADGYLVVCPYKACGMRFKAAHETVWNNAIIKCPNCRKEMKVKIKVTAPKEVPIGT